MFYNNKESLMSAITKLPEYFFIWGYQSLINKEEMNATYWMGERFSFCVTVCYNCVISMLMEE